MVFFFEHRRRMLAFSPIQSFGGVFNPSRDYLLRFLFFGDDFCPLTMLGLFDGF